MSENQQDQDLNKSNLRNIDITQYTNGFWYVIDIDLHQTIAITITHAEAVQKCVDNGWINLNSVKFIDDTNIFSPPPDNHSIMEAV